MHRIRVGVAQAISALRCRVALVHTLSIPQYRDGPPIVYRKGGHHPMKLGKIVHGQYEVIGQLGSGVYSVVWLAKSQSNGTHVAMKVLKAALTDLPELHETEYLQRILTADPTHPGFRHNLHLLSQFHIYGPNGKHLCLVTELLGESLDQYTRRFSGGRIPLPKLRNIVRQVILAMMYLHDKCDIIHTDIKASNILFASPAHAASESISLPNPTVKLIDLGVACWADRVEEHFTDLIQSPELRAPEVAVGAGWGKPVDIWSLGCLVYELALGEFLFDHDIEPISVPYLHATLLGPHPPSLKLGKYRDVFFKDDGSMKYTLTERVQLADVIRDCLPDDPDTERLIQFLELMLCIDPTERASLQTLIGHPWLASN
ncbi:kinase-like protein [Mycena sanguinolenta]|nr:kinase-like protein [Mycena sanguinolenta]